MLGEGKLLERACGKGAAGHCLPSNEPSICVTQPAQSQQAQKRQNPARRAAGAGLCFQLRLPITLGSPDTLAARRRWGCGGCKPHGSLRKGTELCALHCRAADLGAWQHSGCGLQLLMLLRLQLINQITLLGSRLRLSP